MLIPASKVIEVFGMKRHNEEFSLLIDVSPEWVSFFPFIFGVLILCSTLVISDFNLRHPVEVAGIWICAVTPFSWLLTKWHIGLGKAFDLMLLASAVILLVIWQDTLTLLPLLVIPTGLAAILLGVSAATVAASLETVFLLVWRSVDVFGLTCNIELCTVILLWVVVILMALAQLPSRRATGWAWHYYQEALEMRKETYNHRETLKQMVQAQANANRQLAMVATRMAGLRAIAEDAQKTKTMFLAKVSHEFRTPLNMIIGLVQLMAESPRIYATALPPEMEQDLKVVLRNCRHLSSMVDDVLDLTRVEEGRVKLNREWIHLTNIVSEAVNVVLPLVVKKGLRLEVDVPDDLPDVYCDRTRIRQVLLNLVSNAARFTERGSVTIRARARDGYIVARVIDTGPGISPESLNRIFEPFFQSDQSFWRDKGGTGLGLSISRQFVQLHQGRLWVESEPGVGSSFNFELPIPQPLDHVAYPGHYIREDWIWREAAFRTEGTGIAMQARKPHILLSDRVGSLYPELERFSSEIGLSDIGDLSNVQDVLQDEPANLLLLNSEMVAEPVMPPERFKAMFPGTLFVQCAVPVPDARVAERSASGYLIKPVSAHKLAEVITTTPGPVRRVLVVDDDPDICDLYTRMIHSRNADLEVETAANGEEALTKVSRATFDLVLLDLLMPGMDGWTCLEQIRDNAHTADLPVFVISAQDPADEPARSPYLFISMEEGFSVKRLLRCSLELAQLLMVPEGELDPTPPQVGGGESALQERQPPPAQAPNLPL